MPTTLLHQNDLVPAPIYTPQKPARQQPIAAAPRVSYSWSKSYKTIREHKLLSLVAFEARKSSIYAELATPWAGVKATPITLKARQPNQDALDFNKANYI